MLQKLFFLLLANSISRSGALEEATNTNLFEKTKNRKAFQICNILGGLDVTRHISSITRNFFEKAIEDVELMREVVSEFAINQGIRGGLGSLEGLSTTLDWEARNLSNSMSTVEAGLGYTDDRKTRRIDRYVSLENEPIHGSKELDLQILDSVSGLFPWIVDRRSKEEFWYVDHQNGRSEGNKKKPFLFDKLYLAAWIISYGDVWGYYPPLRVEGHPLTLGDILGCCENSHHRECVSFNLPENNPERNAIFTIPYIDTVAPGVSIITAKAPIYFKGNFRGMIYDDTYIASTGVDIAVSSISSLLDVIENKMTTNSFGMIVDVHYNTIVISQSVVERIYPERTGLEEARVTYDEVDGSIIQDRRNQPYEVTDTIVQPISNLTNADWKSLNLKELPPGERDYTSLDVLITGEKLPTSFHIFYEKWEHLADWVVLVFVPIQELSKAVHLKVRSDSQLILNEVFVESVKGKSLTTEFTIKNEGAIDLSISKRTIPNWIELISPLEEKQILKANQSLSVKLNVITNNLDVGLRSEQVSFSVTDDNYPDCFYTDSLNVPFSIKVVPTDCEKVTGDPNKVSDMSGTCICKSSYTSVGNSKCVSQKVLMASIFIPLAVFATFSFYVYAKRKHKLEYAMWLLESTELKFDNPPVILGRGTFGLVLLAHFRGTNVAVKRVIPPRLAKKKFVDEDRANEVEVNWNEKFGFGCCIDDSSLEEQHTSQSNINTKDDLTLESGGSIANEQMVEYHSALSLQTIVRSSSSGSIRKVDFRKSSMDMSSSSIISGYTSGLSSGSFSSYLGSRRKKWAYLTSSRTDEYTRLKADFMEEMKQISKLRHPCITTVMGAVISKKDEPMLVMECMEYGSLYDILHNNTMVIDGDFVLSILRDIAQGLLFLHSASPQIIHGDLKSQNILVDIKFRAKVADFGLTQKKKLGGSGTLFWMPPELLRGESSNTSASDVYSFGIVLYEVYSRKNPYENDTDHISKILNDICDPLVNKRPKMELMPSSIESLMSDCLVANPHDRPTFLEINNRLRRLEKGNVEPHNKFFSTAKRFNDSEKSYNLLLEVFPKHIADALRDGRKVEPENHDCVTIYFSDIVGFTIIASELSPSKVSDMLDRLYLAFDALSHKHGVWKIETIGDAWMGVTNLVTKQEKDHSSRIARFGMDAIEAASKTLIDKDNPEMGYVKIRVGMHSGPVLSNVVGSRNPKFSIFGDTVNTSSRMESNSLPGYIHASSNAALLLKEQDPNIDVTCRGIVSIKGKGEMTTFWIGKVPLEKPTKRRKSVI